MVLTSASIAAAEAIFRERLVPEGQQLRTFKWRHRNGSQTAWRGELDSEVKLMVAEGVIAEPAGIDAAAAVIRTLHGSHVSAAVVCRLRMCRSQLNIPAHGRCMWPKH